MAPKKFSLTAVKKKADTRARNWAGTGGEKAAGLHANAPRGGSNLNAYGQPRSAPGEVPAVEFGNLLDRLKRPPARDGEGWAFTVNYADLEEGYITPQYVVAPRPLGAITLAELRAQAKSGEGP